MNDFFAMLKSLDSVKRVSNLHNLDGAINFLFFVCPRIRNKGMTLNPHKTGLTAQYEEGLSTSTKKRIQRVRKFSEEAKNIGVEFSITAIFAAADALILFPLPVSPPPIPTIDGEIGVVSNLEPMRSRLIRFTELYAEKPWKSVPQKFLDPEATRLTRLLPTAISENVKEDFVRRIFAGFALDGLIIREGVFGLNPVILGVESIEVPILQNASLKKDEWLPVVDLVE